MQSGPTYGMQSGPSAADTMRQLQMLQSQQVHRRTASPSPHQRTARPLHTRASQDAQEGGAKDS